VSICLFFALPFLFNLSLFVSFPYVLSLTIFLDVFAVSLLAISCQYLRLHRFLYRFLSFPFFPVSPLSHSVPRLFPLLCSSQYISVSLSLRQSPSVSLAFSRYLSSSRAFLPRSRPCLSLTGGGPLPSRKPATLTCQKALRPATGLNLPGFDPKMAASGAPYRAKDPRTAFLAGADSPVPGQAGPGEGAGSGAFALRSRRDGAPEASRAGLGPDGCPEDT
jgi:hypothetical protein